MTDSAISESKSSPVKAYSKISFWDAYSTIYYSGTENSEITQFAEALIGWLEDSSPDDDKISVLCLGFGVGVFELPLLKQMVDLLKKGGTGKKIRLVAVDNCKEPLLAASKFLQNNWEDIPKTTKDFVSALNVFWPDAEELIENKDVLEWKVKDHLFAVIDLDMGRTDEELDSIFGDQPVEKDLAKSFLKDLPSLWYSRLQGSMARHYKNPPGMDFKFNLILASFIFQHLVYWQRAAVHSLALLHRDGILAFPQIEGDPWLFEGKSPLFRKDAQNETAKQIFSRFYRHNSIKRYWQRQRTNNASDPRAVKDFLCRLESESVQCVEPLSYYFNNSVPLKSYWNLLENRGFSNLRKVEEEITQSTYDKHVHQIKNEMEQLSASKQDLLRIGITWNIYRCRCPGELTTLPLSQKYIGKRNCASIASLFNREFSHACFDYELLEATQLPALSEDLLRESTSFWQTLQQVVTFGIFSPKFMGGVLGPSIINKPLRNLVCFLNPLWESNLKDVLDKDRVSFLVQLVSYNILRKILQENYSNARMLLKSLLPKTPLPPVFTYNISHSIDDLFYFETIWHRNFVEIAFFLNRGLLKRRLRQHLGGAINFEIEFPSDFYHAIAVDLRKQREDDSFPSYVCGVPESHEMITETSLFWAKKIHEAIKDISEGQHKSLMHNEKFRGTLDQQKIFHPELVEEFLDVVDRDMISTVLWTGLIDRWQKFGIFPETYWYGGKKQADDAVILFYSKDLSPEELGHEYRKLELIYEQRGGRKTQEKAEDAGRTSLSHSLPYAVSLSMTNLLKLEEAIETFKATLSKEALESLPKEISEFNQIPTELYAVAVQAALRSRSKNENDFWKAIPRIEWIERPILTSGEGITREFLQNLANKIAYRWARLRLDTHPDDLGMAPSASPNDIVAYGQDIPKERHGLLNRRAVAAFSTALVLILKEAIQHRQLYLHWRQGLTTRERPRSGGSQDADAVQIVTNVDHKVWIDISNPCIPGSRPGIIKGTNQQIDLDVLENYIEGWEIKAPIIENNRWIRRLERKMEEGMK